MRCGASVSACRLADPAIEQHVIAGLDPEIHHFLKKMVARIMSGHDER
jgi:hypothetical protein